MNIQERKQNRMAALSYRLHQRGLDFSRRAIAREAYEAEVAEKEQRLILAEVTPPVDVRQDAPPGWEEVMKYRMEIGELAGAVSQLTLQTKWLKTQLNNLLVKKKGRSDMEISYE